VTNEENILNSIDMIKTYGPKTEIVFAKFFAT